MPSKADVLRVMVASPSDVPEEREAVERAIYHWNALHASSGIVLVPVRWETHATPELGDRPQGLINKRVLSDCDILVGVFSARLGSPTGVAISGTAEEIEEFRKAGRRVMLYFSTAPIPRERLDLDQFRKLTEYQAACQKLGLVSNYLSPDDLYGRVQSDLLRAVQQLQADGKLGGSLVKNEVAAEPPPNPMRQATAELERAVQEAELEWKIEKQSNPDDEEEGQRILGVLAKSLRHPRLALEGRASRSVLTVLDAQLAELKNLRREQLATLGNDGSEFWAAGNLVFAKLHQVVKLLNDATPRRTFRLRENTESPCYDFEAIDLGAASRDFARLLKKTEAFSSLAFEWSETEWERCGASGEIVINPAPPDSVAEGILIGSNTAGPPGRQAQPPQPPKRDETSAARAEILQKCYEAYRSGDSTWVAWDGGGSEQHLVQDRAARELEAQGLINVKFLSRVAFAAELTDAGRKVCERVR